MQSGCPTACTVLTIVRRRRSAVNAASKPFCPAVRRRPSQITVTVVLVVADLKENECFTAWKMQQSLGGPWGLASSTSSQDPAESTP